MGLLCEYACNTRICTPNTERICICIMCIRPPLWSSGQSSWLQIQRSGFDSRRYQFFSQVVGFERGPLSLVSTTEELLGRNSSGSGLEIREYGRGIRCAGHAIPSIREKLALTSPTSGGSSVV
jgi:hypothetical protein